MHRNEAVTECAANAKLRGAVTNLGGVQAPFVTSQSTHFSQLCVLSTDVPQSRATSRGRMTLVTHYDHKTQMKWISGDKTPSKSAGTPQTLSRKSEVGILLSFRTIGQIVFQQACSCDKWKRRKQQASEKGGDAGNVDQSQLHNCDCVLVNEAFSFLFFFQSMIYSNRTAPAGVV